MLSGKGSGFMLRLSVAGALVFGAGALVMAQPPKSEAPKPAPAKAEQPKAADAKPAKAEKEFSVSDGYYVEACSCKPPCPCEMTGPNMSCKGVGAYHFNSAKYDGQDLSGLTFAYSLYIGETVMVYMEVKDAKQHEAAEKFVRAAMASFGTVKAVKDAKVAIDGKDGKYKVTVDGGKIMSFETEPMLGGDKKTPVVHTNTMDALNPTMYQGSCVSCTYTDGDMKVNLDKGRNSYFNQHMKSSGKL